MKKIKFLPVLFSLFLFLFSFLILSSCQDTVNSPEQKTPEIPAGKGLFTLVISDINGRTILPSVTKNNFAEYALEFIPEGGASVTETRTNDTLGTVPILLNAGKYNLHVTAYMNAGGVLPVAYGELNNIEIEEGKNNIGAVSLKVITANTGTFSWNISFSANITKAFMTITPLGPNGTPVQTLYFIGGTPVIQKSDSRALISGYYNVLTTLIKDDTTQKIERRDVLHIYQNLESNFTFTFSDADFNIKNYLVTFVYNNGLDNGLQTCDIDAKINKPTDPTYPGYVFGGWYTTDVPTGGTWDDSKKWDFNDTVIENITLYANWQTAGKFTFQFAITDNNTVIDSGIIITNNTDKLTTANLEVTNADAFDEINWYYNNEYQGTGDTVPLVPSIFENVSGPKFITAQAKKDGVLYSTLVIIWVRLPAARIGPTLYATLYAAIEAAADDGTETVITLLSDVTTPETGIKTNGYNIDNGKNITLTVETDCKLSINASAGGFALFEVYPGGSLALDGSNGSLTLSGGYLASIANRRGIHVNNGTVAVKDNVTIAGFRNTTNSGYPGGGVCVIGATSSFTMSGGTIYGNGNDVPQSLRNEASTNTAAIYVASSGTAKYGGRYGTENISSTSGTLPQLGNITVNPTSGATTYNKLYAVYSGNQMVSYQWLSSSTSTGSSTTITGATSATYTPLSSGYYSVTVSAPGYPSKTSDRRSVSSSTLTGKININPSGKVESGTTLTAGYTGTEPDTNNVAIKYSWEKDSEAISGATTSIYTPTSTGIYSLSLSAAGYDDKASSTGDTVAFITNTTVIGLTDNNWSDGELTATSQQDWYSFNVVSGTTYYVWWNERDYGYGDGTKTADVYVSIIYDNGKIIALEKDYSWGSPLSIPASSSGKIYIQVKPYSSSSLGTYGIVYSSTGNTRPVNNTLPLTNITPKHLSPDVWELDTLSSTTPRYWYSFEVTGGTNYYLWWNDKNNSNSFFNSINGNTPADVDVTVWYNSNKKEAIPNTDTAWSTPKSFNAEMTGTVTILVRPQSASSSNYGTFEIVYSAGNTRPSGAHNSPPNATPLTEGTWENGNLTNANPNKWYSFDVISGTRYYIWCNDDWDGNGSKKGDVQISGYYDSGSRIFTEIDGNWNSPQSFTASSTGTFYIYVEPYDKDTYYLGTFGIVFSTVNTRPPL
ncbi:hypothetical protein R84B8_01742 [Treponema sp. R8-4-B8]